MSYCPDVLQGLITAEGGGRIAEEGTDTVKEFCGTSQRHQLLTVRLGSKVSMCMIQERIFLIFSDKFALMASRDEKKKKTAPVLLQCC